MLKKITKLLLAFVLVLQILSPMITVHANEGDVLPNVEVDDFIDQLEDDQEATLELDVEEDMTGELVDEMLNEDVEIPEVELNGVTELNEDTCPIKDASERDPSFQISIDAMYNFLENNTAENPLVIPTGSTFVEAFEALGWGEYVTTWVLMEGHQTPAGTMGGGISFIFNAEIGGDVWYCDDMYWWDTVIHMQYEDSSTGDSPVDTCPIRDASERDPIFQASIDAMYEFLANNSAENPLVIPTGSDFVATFNDLGWGEHITTWITMEGHQTPDGTLGGGLSFVFNAEIDGDIWRCDDRYGWDTVIYIQYEDSPTNNSTLPQTSTSSALNTMTAGSALLTLGGLATYRKIKKD